MKTLLNKALLVLMLVVTVATTVNAQKSINLRELNTYPYELTTLDSLPKHPLNGVEVTFTAILSSYPKNSGLASYSNGDIGRIHLFVVDTTAASLGRDGMAMQIVQPRSAANFLEIEALSPGAIVDVTGNLTFFGLSAQFNVTAIADVTNKVEGELGDLSRYDALLAPVEINVSDINSMNEDGTIQLNIANYSKFAHAYVKVSNGTIQFTQGAIARPNYVVKNNGTEHLVYSNDISLRYRNDKAQYREGYNVRREADGQFVPPPAGALVNLSGYMVVNNFDAFGRIASGASIFKITPMDDGVLWIGDNRNVNGENGYVWNNDLEVVGFPPTFENAALSIEKPKPNDIVTFSVDILAPSQDITLTSVKLHYKLNAGADNEVEMTQEGNKFSYTFPAFADGDVVDYVVFATSSEDITGEYRGTFLVANVIESIAAIQQTADDAIANSPLAGLGVLNLNITATVVADATDGLVVVHESSNPWSGIYLDARIQAVKDLVRGDVVNITAAEVIEDYDGTGVTYLSKVELKKTGEDSEYANLIPSVTTDEIRATPEAYEGMVLTFTGVEVFNLQADGTNDYGEFEIATSASETKTGLRIDGSYPSSSSSFGSGTRNFSDAYNENAKLGATFESVTGMLYYRFGNPKLLIRKLEDLVADDWTYPVRTFALLAPADEASVDLATLTENLDIDWAPTFDQDGNDVFYFFSLFAEVEGEVEGETDLELIEFIASNEDGTTPKLTLTPAVLDSMLAANGVALESSVTLYWSVAAYDNSAETEEDIFDNLVFASTYAGIEFTEVLRSVTFKRGATAVSNESGFKAFDFALNQNYPNPFNPSTAITFTIPAATKVNLSVYNVLGQRVASLVNRDLSAGAHTYTFDASALSSGMYFYRLEAGANVSVKKMMLIK